MKAYRFILLIALVLSGNILLAEAPGPPNVTGTSPTNNLKPTWTWAQNFTTPGSGNFRYKLNNSDLSSESTETTDLSFTPVVDLNPGSNILYVQERDTENNWSESGSFEIVIDITSPSITNISVDPTLAKLGTSVTIEFDATDASGIPGNPTVTVNGRSATYDSKSGDTYSYKYTIVEADGDGAASINVEATDAAGNTGSETNTTALSVDQTPPAISSITATPSLAKLGTEVTIKFDATDASGIPGNPTVTVNGRAATYVSIDGINYTYSYTIVEADGDGAASINIQATDAAGNTGSTTNTTALMVDQTPPAISSITATPSLAKLGTEVTIEFDATDASGIPDNPTVTVNGRSATYNSKIGDRYSYRYTIAEEDSDGAATIYIETTDVLGNTSNSSNTTALNVDKTAPEVSSITRVSSSPTNLATVQFLVTFSESVTGVTTSNFSFTGTSTGNSIASITETGSTRTVSVTTGTDGTLKLNLTNVTGITDIAGNALASTYSDGQEYDIDKTAPQVSSITRIYTSPTNLTSVQFLVTFNENVTGVITSNFSFSGTSTGNSIASITGTGSTRTVSVTTGTDGTLKLNLTNVTGITDITGNALASTYSDGQEYDIDKTAPQVSSITRINTSPTNLTSVQFLVTFSESVTGVITSSFSFSGTSTGNSIASITGTGSTRTVSVTTGGSGTLKLNLSSTSGIVDGAGNELASTFTIGEEYIIDKTTEPPTLVNPESGSTIGPLILIEFSLGEVAQSGSVKMTFTKTSAAGPAETYVFTFNSGFETAGTHTTTLYGESFLPNSDFESVTGGTQLTNSYIYSLKIEYQDQLGNPVAYITNTNLVYTSVPLSASFTPAPPSHTNTNVSSLTVEFNRRVKVSTVNQNDFQFTHNGANVPLGSMGITDSESSTKGSIPYAVKFHLDVSSLNSDEGTYVMNLLTINNDIVDENTNKLQDGASTSWIIDRTPPSISLSTTVSSPTNSSPIPVTATVNEQVVGFIDTDINVVDATISGFQENPPGSNIYTFDVNPLHEGLIQFNVPANTFTDLAGNNNTASQQISIFYDSTPPNPEITSSLSSPTKETSIPISVDFGEVVTGFTVSDITVSGGTKSDFATTNNRIFTFNLNVSSSGEYTVNVGAGVCSDIAGNSSLAATPFSITFDNIAPTLSSIDIVSNHTNNKWARVGRKVTLSFTANEPIKDVVTSIYGHNVIAATADNLSWAASYTLTDEDDNGVVTFSIDYKDIAGNSGSQVNNTNFGGTNVTFDKTKPVISNVGISTLNPSGLYAKVGDRINVAFTVDDANVTFNAKIRGVGATLEGGPLTWTAYRNLTESDAQGFVTFNITATDLAGNISDAATSTDDESWVIFDKTPPTISSVTVNSGVYKVGDVIVINILADDDLYTKGVALVNGKDQVIVDNKDNTYAISYTVQSGDVEHIGVTTLPVEISLVDIAGNVSSVVTTALVQSGTLTIDSSVPTILTVTSDAEVAGNLIIGSTLTFTVIPAQPETGLTVNPQTYNDQPLIWSTTDGTSYTSTYTVGEGHTTQASALQIGGITFTDQAGNISPVHSYTAIQKSIYATKPTVSISGSTTKCDYGQTVPITFTFTGYQPYTITYNDGTSNIGPILVDANSYQIDVESGTYTLVSLVDNTGNSQTAATQNAHITVNPLPAVTLNITASPFKPDEPPLELAPFATPANGSFTGLGVGTDGKFYPNIVNQDESITITYTYTDPGTGCVNSATDDVLVTSGGAAIVNLAAHYCQYSEPVVVNGSNPDPSTITGTFVVSSPASTWVDNNDNSLTLFPHLMFEGNYQVTYSYVDGGSIYETTRSFLIDSVSSAITYTGLLEKYCENSTSSTLVAVNLYPTGGSGHFSGPAGGFFSEPNSNQAQFVPSNLAPDQTYQVSYYYLSPRGCSSEITTLSALVSSLPQVDFELNHNYNFVGSAVNLMENATPQGGTFSGIGITDASWLRPDLVTPGTTSNIKYSYTSTSTGCSNDITKSTIILRATEEIQGLASEYCYSEDEISISCEPNFNPSIVGQFSSVKEGSVIPTENNQALYKVAAAGRGIDTVFFRYSIEGIDYEVFKRVVIDSVGQVSIDGISDRYCNDNPQVILVGNNNEHGQGFGVFSYSGTSSAFVNQGNLAYLYPLQQEPGTYQITYTYNSNITSCSSQITNTVTVDPIPNVFFAITQSCTDLEEPVQFINNTVSEDEVVRWEWNFNNQGTSNQLEPSFQFPTAGEKRIWLTAESVNGCTVTKDSIVTIGLIPKPNFVWSNECQNQEQTNFVSTTEEVNIANYKWVFDDGTEQEGASLSSISHLFTELGYHNVKLAITSNDGCKDSIVKQVFIQPLISVNELPGNFYFENFENGKGYWDSRSLVENEYYSWNFGMPSGEVINNASSGENSWFTHIDVQKAEKSLVISPCFDLRSLEKPMLKFNVWSFPEVGRDGAVLQYDLNGENNWKNLGSLGDGINWFNSSTIQSQPGGQGQFTGWSGTPMANWASARISLDVIREASNVRFRVAYAADGNAINPFEGFAFDDVWIGNRSREVLVEYFTNNVTTSNISADSYMVSLEESNTLDVNPIHYHTSVPSGDPLYNSYTTGPSAREFFYGLSAIPHSFANGLQTLNLTNTAGNQSILNKEALKDPLFNLSVVCNGDNQINIAIEATALQQFSGKDLILHMAIIEKQVNINNAQSGVTAFYNVLREFLPDPGGNSLPVSMSLGQVFSTSYAWSPININNLSQARVIAFVQDATTKEIYQSGYFDLSTITSNLINEHSLIVNLYPNPASHLVWIESPEIITEYRIIDIAGREIEIKNPLSKNFSISVSDLKSGIYLISLKGKKGQVVKRMVKQ